MKPPRYGWQLSLNCPELLKACYIVHICAEESPTASVLDFGLRSSESVSLKPHVHDCCSAMVQCHGAHVKQHMGKPCHVKPTIASSSAGSLHSERIILWSHAAFNITAVFHDSMCYHTRFVMMLQYTVLLLPQCTARLQCAKIPTSKSPLKPLNRAPCSEHSSTLVVLHALDRVLQTEDHAFSRTALHTLVTKATSVKSSHTRAVD